MGLQKWDYEVGLHISDSINPYFKVVQKSNVNLNLNSRFSRNLINLSALEPGSRKLKSKILEIRSAEILKETDLRH